LDEKGGDVDGSVSGDEAAWRDLIARFDQPVDAAPAAAPWPEAENLTGPPPGTGEPDPADRGPATTPAAPPGPAPAAGSDPGSQGPAAWRPAGPGRARIVRPAVPPPDSPGRPANGAGAPAEPGGLPGGAQPDDERYVPPPPPPLPRLDPVAKGAWVALCGGPAYLLVATLAGWQLPAWAALLAVIAFIGGFTVVVLRMNDGPPGDDGGNGAVLLCRPAA